MWAADASGRVNYWNRAGLEYCGLDLSTMAESSFWDCLHPDDRAEARAAFERDVRGSIPFERQLRLRRAADGAYRWHLARAVPERGEGSAVTGWIATATDIHDQKQAETALRDAIVVRDDFLSVASHELRTPLTSLKLEVANLLRLTRRGALNADGRLVQRVEKIDTQAARLHRLIDELLDVSRIASGHLELELEEVDLAEVAKDVGLRFAEEAARLGCSLTVRAPVSTVGYWDRNRLDQVVTNLISNAIKYGNGKPIEVIVEHTDERALLVVRDNGVGIPPDDHARIFGRFERAVSSRNYGGIGLGLWIVKQIVDALGGSVVVDSRPGLGSTFTTQLPRAQPRTAASRVTLSSSAKPELLRAVTRIAHSCG
jgi:PAS domain S-box-containing protein